jgi:hypothetical protein
MTCICGLHTSKQQIATSPRHQHFLYIKQEQRRCNHDRHWLIAPTSITGGKTIFIVTDCVHLFPFVFDPNTNRYYKRNQLGGINDRWAKRHSV